MDIDNITKSVTQKIADIETSQSKLNELLQSMENDLNRSLEDECLLNNRLKALIVFKHAQNGKHPQGLAHVSDEDPTSQLEKLLQGSLDVLGDKISDRLMAMIKDLKSLPIGMRASKIQEVKRAADEELLDLSALYKHQKIESNIEEVGVTETEAKGIDKNLEKLRMLRQMRLK